jgi:hypothetical protein
MTGFDSKRQAAQAKLDDNDAQVYIAEYEAALLVSYRSGFADGKRSVQRPWVELTASTILNLMPSSIPADHDGALMDFARSIEAKLKERNRGATTHCQCAACKNGNIHDSDCSVHNGDALPVGPCDCSLATPPVQPAEPAQKFYQPAANEAVEILKSLGYVYEPTYTGLAWVAKKSAQLEQEPSQWRDMVVVTLVREGINKHKARELADHFATPPAAQRPWLSLTDEDKKKIATAAGCTEDDDGHIVTEIFRLAEAKLKERNT